MIGPRSTRDRERLLYEAERAVKMLRLLTIKETINGNPRQAEARKRMADDLERAMNGQATGFDWAGGRGEWIQQQQKEKAA
jgi:hypothetical protein